MGRAGGLKKGPQGAAAVKKPREEKEPKGAGEIKSGKAGLVWGPEQPGRCRTSRRGGSPVLPRELRDGKDTCLQETHLTSRCN